jgi:hypothetical protein
MKLAATKSGGFAGVREELGPIDDDALPDDLRAKIEQELERVGFSEMPSEPPRHTPIDDGFNYTITVTDGDRSHCVAFGDGIGRGLFRLLAMVEKAAGGWRSTTQAIQGEGEAENVEWLHGGAGYDRLPGVEDPRLHVVGTCRVRSSSVELTLEPGNAGVVPEPGVAVLRLSASSPEVGDDRMVEREVGWSDDVGPDIEWVRIIGEVAVSLEVTTPE